MYLFIVNNIPPDFMIHNMNKNIHKVFGNLEEAQKYITNHFKIYWDAEWDLEIVKYKREIV